jgi:glycosyltransferase involved in cell wall biosynthesis
MPRIKKEWIDEIIVIDGNSTDGTYEYFKENGYFVARQKSKGVTGAHRECLEMATGDIIITFSPDNNSLPELIPVLVEKMKQGYDMVIASRYIGGARSFDDDIITSFGNWMFTKMINVLFHAHYTDTLVMLRAYRTEIVKLLEMDVEKLPVFEVQMAIRCAKKKMKVADIPADEPKRIGGQRKTKPFLNGLAVLYQIIREIFVWR